MPTVLVTSWGKSFHKSPDCGGLARFNDLNQISLDEITTQRPCLWCYPDAPRVSFVKRFCNQCNTTRVRPCVHNGGVRVPMRVKTGKVSTIEDTFVRWIYVWPDRAHLYN